MTGSDEYIISSGRPSHHHSVVFVGISFDHRKSSRTESSQKSFHSFPLHNKPKEFMINTIIFLFKFLVVVATICFSIFRAVEAYPDSSMRIARPTTFGIGVHQISNRLMKNPRKTSQSFSSSLLDSKTQNQPSEIGAKEYAPSQNILDPITGEKWRLCAGAAVLNSRNELLVGERIGRPDNWQCPQGGVDDEWIPHGEITARPRETIVEACQRELFEEMGLKYGVHVILDPSFPEPTVESRSSGVRYSTTGTNNWLTKAGFAGQELHWTVFRCVDGPGDFDPSAMCDLSGLGGESAEFSQTQWKSVESAVKGIWEGKRAPYTFLKSLIDDHVEAWNADVCSLDFSGRWERDASQNKGIVDGLIKRGLSPQNAEMEAQKSYIQSWEANGEIENAWQVTTYASDGKTPRRQLDYRPGEWEETYQGEAVLFGKGSEEVTLLKRRTSFVGEPDASPLPIAQVTITSGPKGMEESRRYLKDGRMVLRRTLWPEDKPQIPIVSEEVFLRTK